MGSRPSRQTQLTWREPVMLSRISNFPPALCSRPSQPLRALQGLLLFKRRVLITHSLKVLCLSAKCKCRSSGAVHQPGVGRCWYPSPVCICSASSSPDPGLLLEPRWLIPHTLAHRSHTLVGRYPCRACACDFWVILASFLQQLK